MNREEFIKKCALMGVGISLAPSFLSSCKKDDLIDVNFSGNVIIIGAGSAGMMAAYTLNKYNIDFTVLEASSIYGGRVKQTTTLADFPIDLGAEWIHDKPKIFSELIDDDSVEGSIDLIPYQPSTLYTWNNGKLSQHNWASSFYGEYKFKSTTWYQFFENFIVPNLTDNVVYNSPVTSIDHSGSQVTVTDLDGNTYSADRVIVTVPLNILKSNYITFTPAFPQSKTDALAKTNMPDGLKIFIKFSQKFYPDILTVTDLVGATDAERIYYDGAFKKDTNDHVLALFNVGENASEFTDLGSDEEIFAAAMADLDEMFDNKASQYYLDHVVQNWTAEPFIQGAYSFGGDDYESTQIELSEPLSNKVYFAGEALDINSWATVHGAGLNGVSTAKTILQNG